MESVNNYMRLVNRVIAISILLLTSMVSICIAENPLTFFVVYRASFSQSNLDNFKTFGDKFDRQPARRADLYDCTNTNYYVIGISTWTKAQQDVIELFEQSGRVIKIKSIWGLNDKASPNTIREENFKALPSDIDRKWQVHISS